MRPFTLARSGRQPGDLPNHLPRAGNVGPQGQPPRPSSRGRHRRWACRAFRLFLRILHHDDELGDAICLHVILRHISAEGDHVNSVQAATVDVKESHNLDGRDLCVEGLGVFEIVVPDLVDNIAEKFGNATFGRFV